MGGWGGGEGWMGRSGRSRRWVDKGVWPEPAMGGWGVGPEPAMGALAWSRRTLARNPEGETRSPVAG